MCVKKSAIRKLFFITLLFLTARLFSNSPLEFGNPSNAENHATSEEPDPNNYLLEKSGYTLSYNFSTLCPNWVAWHLDESDFGNSGRSNSFKPDTTLPENFYQVKSSDYKFPAYGFDRGHVCPSADRTSSPELNKETFLMTNMIPQCADLNRKAWMHLENFEREMAKDGHELYIIAGPYGTGGESERGYFEYIPIPIIQESLDAEENKSELRINVPSHSWKIILRLPSGEDDIMRVTEETTILAVLIPNVQGCHKDGDWQQYITTVDYIEELTGYDFFSELPDEIEDALEAKIWNGVTE